MTNSIKKTNSFLPLTRTLTVLCLASLCQGGALAVSEPVGLLPRSGEKFTEQREKARINRAVAHYARSRSLLLAALSEYDKAASLADPSLLLDGKKWRADVARKAKQLERVLSPQPREAKAGVKLEADPRLIKR